MVKYEQNPQYRMQQEKKEEKKQMAQKIQNFLDQCKFKRPNYEQEEEVDEKQPMNLKVSSEYSPTKTPGGKEKDPRI